MAKKSETPKSPTPAAAGRVPDYLLDPVPVPDVVESDSDTAWGLWQDSVQSLDVAILQNNLLAPILGISDPRTDKRIDFVGGIRGTGELERRCREGAAVAFSMYPTSLGQLMAVADSGEVMPPKSTWFEPKLRSGLTVRLLDE